jgi:CshA-type fibril repeat protein
VTPVAVDDAASAPFGQPVTVDVRGNDHGSDLTVTGLTDPPAGEGAIAIVAGNVVYTPPAGFTGTTTFRYTITDGAGQMGSATVAVTVGPSALAAIGRDDTTAGAPGRPVTFDPLANDTPAEPSAHFVASTLRLIDPVTRARVLSLTVAGEGTYTVDSVTGLVTFVPVPGFSGTLSAVGYEVTDSLGMLSTAVIRISYPAVQPAAILPTTGQLLAPLMRVGVVMLTLGLLLMAGARTRRRRKTDRST